jgi:hypothetical protein
MIMTSFPARTMPDVPETGKPGQKRVTKKIKIRKAVRELAIFLYL